MNVMAITEIGSPEINKLPPQETHEGRPARIAVCGHNRVLTNLVLEAIIARGDKAFEIMDEEDIPKEVVALDADVMVLIPEDGEQLHGEIVANTRRGLPFVVVQPVEGVVDVGPLYMAEDFYQSRIIPATGLGLNADQPDPNPAQIIHEAAADYRLWT